MKLTDWLYRCFFNSNISPDKALKEAALSAGVAERDVYRLLKVGRARDQLVQATWCQLFDSKYLQHSFLEWVLEHPAKWQSLPANLRDEVAEILDLEEGDQTLELSLSRGVTSHLEPHVNTGDQLDQEAPVVHLANPKQLPWQHPVLYEALINISGCKEFNHIDSGSPIQPLL